MEIRPKWADHFKLSDGELSALQAQVPQSKSLLRYCLEQSRFTGHEYLAWAKTHYQLPCLKDNFDQYKKAHELKMRYGNIWPDFITPLSEWDGVLFLACLEPVDNFKAPQKYQWVLCSLEQLLKLKNEDIVVPAAPIAHLPDAPQGLNLDFGKLPDLSIPEGLSLDLSAPLTTSATVDSTLPPPLPTDESANLLDLNAPAGLNLDTASLLSDGAPQGLQFEPPAPPRPPPPPPPQQSTLDLNKAHSIDDVGSNALTELSKHFDQSMVLLFQNEQLQPWKWTPSWRRDMNRATAIDLSTPSVFRIVSESKDSYHGYIVPNMINDAFFQTWNQGQYPEHLTITPLMVNKQLMGMLLGVCTKTRAKNLTLKNLENFSQSIAEAIVKISPSQAA